MKPIHLRIPLLLTSLVALSPAFAQIAVKNQGYIPYSDAPIFYRSDDINDPVAKLQKQLEQGQAQLVLAYRTEVARAKYPYLIAGAPAEMWEKVPQLVNLNTWRATVFVGWDGKVRAVHAGFASPASGEFHAQLKQEFTERIETLLSEKAPVQLTSTADDRGSEAVPVAANVR
jgi:hypothetical protein